MFKLLISSVVFVSFDIVCCLFVGGGSQVTYKINIFRY